MSFEFGERLNVLTGDNGLGKSFVLDLAWWALTGTWAERPPEPSGESPRIHCRLPRTTDETGGAAMFLFPHQRWSWERAPDAKQGPVIYLTTDRIFVFDPYRNIDSYNEPRGAVPSKPYPDAFRFGWPEIWDGIEHEGRIVCN